MQKEITNRTVALIVDGAKMTEQTFEKAVKKFLEETAKGGQPKIYRGKQTLKQLAGQNAGLANIEVNDKNIRAFTRVAKKYHVDFALKKDTAAEQPRYLVFFKSRDADAITAAFQEFANRRIDIYLNFIGAFEVPAEIVTPAEEAEQLRRQEEQAEREARSQELAKARNEKYKAQKRERTAGRKRDFSRRKNRQWRKYGWRKNGNSTGNGWRNGKPQSRPSRRNHPGRNLSKSLWRSIRRGRSLRRRKRNDLPPTARRKPASTGIGANGKEPRSRPSPGR